MTSFSFFLLYPFSVFILVHGRMCKTNIGTSNIGNIFAASANQLAFTSMHEEIRLKGFQMRLRDFKRKTVILFMSDNMHSNGVNISLRYTKKLYIRFAFFRNTIIENCGKTPTVNLLPSPV